MVSKKVSKIQRVEVTLYWPVYKMVSHLEFYWAKWLPSLTF